jgi:AraC family transcriptional regulator of adaptative response/methylated-DNA-[protein]-cysteine methyltransferase
VKQKGKDITILKATWLDSPLGPMLAIANDEFLYLLEFVERRGLEREIERLRAKTNSTIIRGRTKPIESIESELKQYYVGTLKEFKTPLHLLGSPFQQEVWAELQKIPPGETRSYSDIAIAIKRPSSQRAVANASGANQLAIIIPCHRVIQANGKIGGYAGGISRKQWLLNHERPYSELNLH